jgi:hypothetical protein
MEILAGESLFALFIAAHLLAVVALSLEESEKNFDHRGRWPVLPLMRPMAHECYHVLPIRSETV